MKRYTLFLAMALTVITLQSTFTSTASADTISIQTLLSPMLLAEVQSDNTTTEQPVEHRTTWGALKAIYRGNTPQASPDQAQANAAQLRKQTVTPMALSYPAWYKELPVPFLSQFSVPGSTTATKNCGQTCSAMIRGFYYHFQPSAADIIAIDKALDKKFPGLGYANPNSYYTNVDAPRYALTYILQTYYYPFSSYVITGANSDNLSRIFRCINAGYPVIACVMISGGNIVATTSNAVPHWVVLVGFDQGGGGQVIMHNPGTSDDTVGGKGKYHHMLISDFLKSWSMAGGQAVPVTYPICAYF